MNRKLLAPFRACSYRSVACRGGLQGENDQLYLGKKKKDFTEGIHLS